MFGHLLAGRAGPFRYLRLVVDAVNGGTADLADIGDLRWLNPAGTAYPTSNMTSNSAPSPLVASASSSSGVDDEGAFGAFDASATTRWQSAAIGGSGQWITIDLGSGTLIVPAGVRITPRASRYPSTFRCQGSRTGSFAGEQFTFYSKSGVTTGWTTDVARTFTF